MPAVTPYITNLERTRPTFNNHIDKALWLFPHLPADQFPPRDDMLYVVWRTHEEHIRVLNRGSMLAATFAFYTLQAASARHNDLGVRMQPIPDRLRECILREWRVARDQEVARYEADGKSLRRLFA
jgi:hypothetical protein